MMMIMEKKHYDNGFVIHRYSFAKWQIAGDDDDDDGPLSS